MCVGVTVDLSEYDVNAVASLLKLYLRELQEPLIPQILIPQFDAAASMKNSVVIIIHYYYYYYCLHVLK